MRPFASFAVQAAAAATTTAAAAAGTTAAAEAAVETAVVAAADTMTGAADTTIGAAATAATATYVHSLPHFYFCRMYIANEVARAACVVCAVVGLLSGSCALCLLPLLRPRPFIILPYLTLPAALSAGCPLAFL
jgi:hypothetical protein